VDKHVSSSAVWELMYFGNPMGSEWHAETMDKNNS
jgi:hypothetical protein